MKYILTLIASIWILFYSLPVFSQTLTIDHKTQRFLGTVSDLDRTRFFTVHADANGTDPDLVNFMNDYNVTPGRQFWGPFSPQIAPQATSGIYPAYQNGPTGVRSLSNYVATQHPKDVIRWNINKTTAANWVVEYFKDFSTSPPKFFEPMNEPFVHAGDPEFSAQQPDQALMRVRMAEWFGEIGKKIHADPALVNMKVIGYSSAWPSMERSNFGHWNDRMKMFMDVAGADMDAFATHLYDGLNVTGQSNFRSGSNSEAILDLIETYSVIKWGIVKDHAITEYGGIESGYPSTYSDTKSIQSVRSINHIIFNLLERENNMAISIPFITGKANWHINAQNNYQPYSAVLFRPSNLGQPNPTGWVYTPRVHFYELWKEVKGKRVYAKTDNPDIQAQVFVDNNKMYVAINNLDDNNQVLKLNFIKGLGRVQSIQKKSLKIYPNQAPIFSNTFINSPDEITLETGETVVLEYTFNQNIAFDNSIRSAKYYSNTYLQDINANSPISFAFNGVTTGTGIATLRMSIGRYHNNNSSGVSKRPVITINGTTIATPSNWKGYDQASRSDFFGTIEIPVPMHLIQANNVVSITFPDNGGKVASLILQVEKYDNAVPAQSAYPTGVAHSIPGLVECENYDLGGQNKAYYDADPSNLGSSISNYRITEGVDISAHNTAQSSLYAIGWTRVGEWVEYTVDVAQTGRYQANIQYSAGSNNTGEMHLAFNGEKTNSIQLPPTGSWSTFNNVSQIVTLSAGLQILRVHVNSPGFNLDNISFSLLPPANESISLINPPSSIASSTSMTFEVAYGTPVSRDLVVEFWSATSWLTQETVTVPAGQGNRNITLNFANAPAPGTGYIIKSSIRPVGGIWSTAIDFDNAHNITVTSNDSIRLINTPSSVPSSTSMTFEVAYEASVARDLVVEFWSATNWLGQETVTVPAGQGNRNVTINLANAPAPGTGYMIKANIRPVGGGWMTSLDADNAHNITVSSTDSIRLINTPSSILSSTSMTFEVAYEASVARDLVVEFWSATNWLGQETVTVPAGQGNRNVTINLANAPAPGTGYLIKSSIRPVGGSAATVLDFDNAHNITVTVNDSIRLINTPSSIPSSTSMTFEVAYEAPVSRDLVVEFWSATNWLGQETLTVPAGQGNRNVTINLANAPAPGSGYLVKASIRPVGGNWMTALDLDQAHNITVTPTDSIRLINTPSSIPSSTSMTFEVAYEAPVSRDLVVEFWSATSSLGEETITVPAGQGNRNITVNLANAPAPGSDYLVKASIRPIGGNSATAIDFDNAYNITVTSTDSIRLINTPSSIPNSTAMTFEVAYEAPVSRDLVVEFWSATNWLGQETLTVPAGQGSRNITVNLANAPAPGSGYLVKASIRPVGGNWMTALDLDQAHNITVTAPQIPYFGTANSIPGSVEAEHYDLGGEGVAYHDLSAGNSGNQFRTDQVDIEITGDSYGTYNVGWISTGEWLEYTVNCATSANYDLYMRVASPYNTAQYKVFIDGVDKTGVINVPNTGHFQSYQTVRTTKLGISAGTHIVRIQAVSGGFNFNDWAMWIPSPSARETNTLTSINESKELHIYPNPTNKAFVYVEFKDLKEKAALQIFNVQGKLVKEIVLKDPYSQIDLHGIQNGVYLIRITEDEYSTVKKLIIQK